MLGSLLSHYRIIHTSSCVALVWDDGRSLFAYVHWQGLGHGPADAYESNTDFHRRTNSTATFGIASPITGQETTVVQLATNAKSSFDSMHKRMYDISDGTDKMNNTLERVQGEVQALKLSVNSVQGRVIVLDRKVDDLAVQMQLMEKSFDDKLERMEKSFDAKLEQMQQTIIETLLHNLQHLPPDSPASSQAAATGLHRDSVHDVVTELQGVQGELSGAQGHLARVRRMISKLSLKSKVRQKMCCYSSH